MSKRYWWEKGASESPWLGHDDLREGPVDQIKKVPAITSHSPAAQGVPTDTRVFHALATPGFSTQLLAPFPSSTTDTHAPHSV